MRDCLSIVTSTLAPDESFDDVAIKIQTASLGKEQDQEVLTQNSEDMLILLKKAETEGLNTCFQ